MSVNWSWKERMGVMYLKQSHPATGEFKFKINIYGANCLGALIYDYKDEETKKAMYQFWGFWNDITHLKRCLGLVKGFDNIYVDKGFQSVLKVKLNTHYKDCLKIADCFVKAGIKVGTLL
ncbi:MAG: hypothetical protein NC087_01600 [Anaeroplasma bactoclasticum]|nr:hypothetical protein [Anaeroplasma bactoclasticum]